MKKEAIKEDSENVLGFSEIVLFGVFLIIGVVFFVLLSRVDPAIFTGTGNVVLSPGEDSNFDFGVGEILFSLAFAFLMTGFLLWTKSMSIKNAYLGTSIGILGGVIVGYGFSLKYQGFYSTLFTITTALFVVGYLGMNFLKYRKDDKYIENEFD